MSLALPLVLKWAGLASNLIHTSTGTATPTAHVSRLTNDISILHRYLCGLPGSVRFLRPKTTLVLKNGLAYNMLHHHSRSRRQFALLSYITWERVSLR
jgi:hypothetical protein